MTTHYPLLPLRDIVVFPQMIVPLFVGRDKSVAALEAAMEGDKEIFLVSQLDPAEDDPGRDSLYDTGVVAVVLQLLKLPDGTVRVLVEGKHRAQLKAMEAQENYLVAEIAPVEELAAEGPEAAALMRSVAEQFENYAKLNKKLPAETAQQLGELVEAAKLSDALMANVQVKVADKQALLVETDPVKRLEMVFAFMEGELGVLQVEKKIRGRVKRQMEKTQREYYLNEQLKAIQRELGNGEGEEGDELAELTEKIAKTKLSKEARSKATAELKKLKAMQPMSAEATVVRNYLDVLLGLPWGKKGKVKNDLKKAQDILDEDHFALEKVKDRIIEYLAVQARTNKLKGPILCLVGPPGVGKTSLGRSIAKATGREFVRQSLGGVRDEADVGLVDPHAERDRGADHHILGFDEGGLVGGAHRCVESGVIDAHRAAGTRERFGHLLGSGARLDIDDAGAGGACDQVRDLARRIVARGDRIADVGPVEPGDDHPVMRDAELFEDISAGMFVGRRRQRQPGDVRELVQQRAEQAIIGAEIMPPFADAMRLVDREQRDASAVQKLAEVAGRGAFGRDIEQVELAGFEPRDRLAAILVGAGQRASANAHRFGRTQLVVHQRDEGRDDDAGAVQHHRRQLVAQRLSSPRRHHHHAISTREDLTHNLLLAIEKLLEAKGATEHLLGLFQI